MASEAIAGRPSGRISRTKIRTSDAPSMRAASRMSFGIPAKKLRSRKIANGSPKAMWKRTIPSTVSNRLEVVVQREHRDQRHLQRHDEQRHDHEEDPVAARELQPRERVAGEDADDDRRGRVLPTAICTVVHSESMIALLWKTCAVVLPGREARLREDLPPAAHREGLRGQDRGQEQPDRRHQPEQAEHEQQDLHGQLRGAADEPRAERFARRGRGSRPWAARRRSSALLPEAADVERRAPARPARTAARRSPSPRRSR